MALTRFRRRLRYKRPPSRAFHEPPGPWPVDPELSRRTIETRRRIEHTRRQLARHVLPKRGNEDRKAA